MPFTVTRHLAFVSANPPTGSSHCLWFIQSDLLCSGIIAAATRNVLISLNYYLQLFATVVLYWHVHIISRGRSFIMNCFE